MSPLPRIALGIAALLPLRAALASGDSDTGPIRVAVVTDVTKHGKNFAQTHDGPIYYVPIFIGYKELGGVLAFYHRPSSPMPAVQHAVIDALAQQGYSIATAQSPAPKLIIAVRWGTIAPALVPRPLRNGGKPFNGPVYSNGIMIANRDNIEGVGSEGPMVLTNRPEIMAYIVGQRWRDYFRSAVIDPNLQELVANLHDLNAGARYFLMISALDYQTNQKGSHSLLWRAHVSTQYWGHYLDEVLGTMITTSAPLLGRETVRPQIFTVPPAPVAPVPPGSPVYTYAPPPPGVKDEIVVNLGPAPTASPSAGSGQSSGTAPDPESIH